MAVSLEPVQLRFGAPFPEQLERPLLDLRCVRGVLRTREVMDGQAAERFCSLDLGQPALRAQPLQQRQRRQPQQARPKLLEVLPREVA